MNKSFYLINNAKEYCVKTKDLIIRLKSKKIKGARFDILEFENNLFENLYINKENEDFNYLINSHKVILTPHIAG